jgi:hypothetical protein
VWFLQNVGNFRLFLHESVGRIAGCPRLWDSTTRAMVAADGGAASEGVICAVVCGVSGLVDYAVLSFVLRFMT